MGFWNRLKKPKYAADFKKAYEKDDFSEMASIMMKWVDENSNDANFSLAMILLMSHSDKDYEELDKMWTRSLLEQPEDKKLHDWYKTTARGIMDERKSSSGSGGSGDNGYAKEFLECLNKFDDAGDSEQERLYNKMTGIVDEWGKKYPDDSNYTCAYVIVNIMDLSEKDLAEYLMKANNQTPIDESCNADLLGHMTKFAMMRNGDDELAGMMDDLLSGDSGKPDKGYAKQFVGYMDEFEVTSNFSDQEKLHKKMEDLVDKWEDEFPDDANFTCAYIIMNIMNFSPGKISELLSKLKNQTPLDKDSHDKLLKNMRDVVRIKDGMEDEVIDTKVVDDSSSDFDGPDGGLAKEFMHCYNKFETIDDYDEQAKLFERMTEIVDEWGRKYPEDSNYSCAYVIMNVMNFGHDELFDYMLKIPSQTAVDESVHDELFVAMTKVVMNRDSDGSSSDGGSSTPSDDGYAKEFLECYNSFENTNDFDEQLKLHERMSDILTKWGDKYPDDANYTCAYIMMNVVDFSPEKIAELTQKAKSQTPIDKESHSELMAAVSNLTMMKDGGSDGEKSEDEDKKPAASNKYSSLDCSEFAKEFITCFDKVREGDSSAMDEMGEIVDAWEQKCPDDANFTCAYIMMNIDSLDDSQLSQLVDKINGQTPVDEDSYEFMLSNMMGLVKFRNENS